MSFNEAIRYEYPLTPDSVVVDAGVYKGEFSRLIAKRYDCTVIGFEPVREFFTYAQGATCDLPRVRIFNFGIADQGRLETFGLKGDATGMFTHDAPQSVVQLVDPFHFLLSIGKSHINLLKLNIEGGEFEILESMFAFDRRQWFPDYIQVQFHPVAPDAEKRYTMLQTRLAQEYDLQWCEPWVWESWKRKKL